MRKARWPIRTGLALAVHTAWCRGLRAKSLYSLTTDPKMPLVAAAPLSNRIYSLMLRQGTKYESARR